MKNRGQATILIAIDYWWEWLLVKQHHCLADWALIPILLMSSFMATALVGNNHTLGATIWLLVHYEHTAAAVIYSYISWLPHIWDMAAAYSYWDFFTQLVLWLHQLPASMLMQHATAIACPWLVVSQLFQIQYHHPGFLFAVPQLIFLLLPPAMISIKFGLTILYHTPYTRLRCLSSSLVTHHVQFFMGMGRSKNHCCVDENGCWWRNPIASKWEPYCLLPLLSNERMQTQHSYRLEY